MKKKGLIIATIVMVLVLAVSLTTATYAWFTVANETTIDPIGFAVTSDADVLIGLKQDNTYAASVTPTSFMYGNTVVGNGFTGDAASVPTVGSSYWTEGTPGLGNTIALSLELNDMKKAVGTGKVEKEAGTLDTTTLRTIATDSVAGPVQAAGEAEVVTAASVERAIAQQHYVDVVIGVQANQADLTKIICNVTINPTVGQDLGINAAIFVDWAINGMADGTNKTDVYGDNHYGKLLGELGTTLANGATDMSAFGGSEDDKLNAGAANLAITVAQAASGESISRADIYQLHLVIWIDGADEDALSAALNVASDIYVTFQAEHPDRV